ncbi:MAG: NrfD/PsrC family molybdoenzyme membrane anchor subunit, partial [Dehalococcoidia bacterium]
LIMYTGFVLGEVRAIAFWNATLIPMLFILYSLLGGTGLTLAIHRAFPRGAVNIERLETIALWLLSLSAVVMIVYLDVMYRRGPGAKQSVLDLVKGRISVPFILGVVVLGIIIPLSVASYGFIAGVSWVVLTTGAVCELIGGFSLRYSLLKAGTYEPLI